MAFYRRSRSGSQPSRNGSRKARPRSPKPSVSLRRRPVVHCHRQARLFSSRVSHLQYPNSYPLQHLVGHQILHGHSVGTSLRGKPSKRTSKRAEGGLRHSGLPVNPRRVSAYRFTQGANHHSTSAHNDLRSRRAFVRLRRHADGKGAGRL